MTTYSSPRTHPPIHVHVVGEDVPGKFTQPFRIGRASANDLVFQHPSVSEEHAAVWFESGQWWIRDLESTNGTLVGGRQIDRTPITDSLKVRLGHDGPALVLSPEGAEHHARPTLSETSESQIVERYLSDDEPQDMSRRTEMVRRIFRKEQERRSQKYLFVLFFLFLAAIAAGAYAFVQRQAIERQRAAASELFYAMKSLELEVTRLQLSNAEEQSYRDRRADLQQRYQDFIEELGIYGSGTPEPERLIYQIVHKFGESEVNVPPEFVREVKRYIERWTESPRLEESIARAAEHGYAPRIASIMLQHGLPPEFFYLALQESSFKIDAVGPRTRFGIAKGMWQLIPGTAREYGLQPGPLVGVRRYDPRDDRHDFDRSTQAAAEYLRDIYTTDAQASGLLVIASYNWGQTRLLRLLRTLPQSPETRNYWTLLTRYRDRIPRETYDYVFKIVSAAVIGENPSLFGFHFAPPLRRAVETAESDVSGP
jgi:pSer/pThr/pTyr-binding forkhead associated (FHA) protein